MIEGVFSVLFLVLLVLLIIGLINPSLILRWSKKPTRIKVIGLWFLINLILMMLLAICSPKPTSQEHINSAEKSIEKERHNDSLKLLVQTEREKFDVVYDEFKEITWLYSKTKPAYANTKAFYTYIGINEQGHAWRRLVIRYHGEDWLFVQSIVIKTDKNTYTLTADDVKRDNNTEVWEWIDIVVGEGEDIILHDIIHSQQTKVRFVGYQYHHDWTLPAKVIKGLKEIDDYYYLLDAVSKMND